MFRKKKSLQLWGRDFSIAKDGLAETEVVEFVNGLIARQPAPAQPQAGKEGFPQLLTRHILAEAQQEATTMRLRARAEAEAEAARLVAEAQGRAQQIVSEAIERARASAEQQAKGILDEANRKALLAEDHALQMAHRFLIKTRGEIQERIGTDAREAYSRILSSLQELLSNAQTVQTEWVTRQVEPWWGTPSDLKDYQTALLDAYLTGDMKLEALPQQTDTQRQEAMPQLGGMAASDVVAVLQEPSAGGGPDPRSRPGLTAQPAAHQLEAAQGAPLASSTPAALQAAPAPAIASQQMAAEGPTQAAASAVAPPVQETAAPAPSTSRERPRGRPAAQPATDVAAPTGEAQLYSGEVEVVIAPPVSASQVSLLFNHLQTIPDIKVLRASGSWERGTTVSVAMENPLPLVELLAQISELAITSATPPLAPGTAGTQRVTVTFKDQETPAAVPGSPAS